MTGTEYFTLTRTLGAYRIDRDTGQTFDTQESEYTTPACEVTGRTERTVTLGPGDSLTVSDLPAGDKIIDIIAVRDDITTADVVEMPVTVSGIMAVDVTGFASIMTSAEGGMIITNPDIDITLRVTVTVVGIDLDV